MKTVAALLAAVAIAALTLLPSTPALATGHRIQINEIYYNSPGTDTGSNSSLNAEWVRITNHASTSRSLGGWKLKDAQNHVFTFPSGFRLAAGASVKVHSGKGTNSGGHRYWGQAWYVWNNSGDKATLRSNTGAILASCSWGSTGSYKYC